MGSLGTVLITGADGFIGSHLTEMAVNKASKVKALSFYNSFNYWGWLDDIGCRDDVEVLTGDIRDPFYCRKITMRVDTVFHLAALIGIPYSYIAPANYVETNIKGTVNICQAALDSGCRRVVHTSTSEVYGTALYAPMDEKHPLRPQSPYSATKIGADALSMSYHHAFGLPLVIARPFNTYGPRQSPRAIIPNIIIQLAKGKKIVRLGNFTYVEDTCRALIALAEKKSAIGQTLNIGSNSEISIKDLFRLIVKIMRVDAKYAVEARRLRPGDSEVFRLKCDNKKIKKLAGWHPAYSLEEGLVKTIEWFSMPHNLSKFNKEDIYNV